MSGSGTPMPAAPRLPRLLALLSDLRLAIVLLLLIAIASGVGTAIPQREIPELYHRLYDSDPWLGLLRADALLWLQFDHIYSSRWFLLLLAWLGLSLLLCSWRRQWPALQASLRWIDYSAPRQLSKLSLAETRASRQPQQALERLELLLRSRGWQVRRHPFRLAARRGLSGRVGPLLVHAGLVLLLVGAAWGAVAGQRLEQFLAPGRELELLDSRGMSQMTILLQSFAIDRDPAGRPEQFRSSLQLRPETGRNQPAAFETEISVNHPLRYHGLTLYQADWSLAAITLQLGRSPLLQVPLQAFPQLGEQVWGVVLPTRPDGSEPVLLALSSEQGPADVYGPDGERLGQLPVGGAAQEVRGLPVRLLSVLPASGILLKRDPGVPLVYAGFAVALLGSGLSLVTTRQLWAIAEEPGPAAAGSAVPGSAVPGRLHLAGLCNRNLPALAADLPLLLQEALAGSEGEAVQQG